jgi:membrane fusion protein (multidrug efflux system)
VPQGNRQIVFKIVPGPEPDTKVSQRTEVKIGLRIPGKVEVLEGLTAGDTVVTAGQQRLQRDGTVVRIIDVPRGGPGGPGGPGGAGPAAAAASGASAAAGGPVAGGPGGRPGEGRMAAGPGGRPGGPGARGGQRLEGPNPCIQAMGDAPADAPRGPRGPGGPGGPGAPRNPAAAG